jgi:endogenous inhibitor of DNA gyrase (YacG/DUF329 family)
MSINRWTISEDETLRTAFNSGKSDNEIVKLLVDRTRRAVEDRRKKILGSIRPLNYSKILASKNYPKKVICKYCNKEFEVNQENKNIKFCSDECKSKSRIKINILNMKCINCGKEYYTENLDKDTCTLKCKREVKLIKVTCPICNKEFNTPRAAPRKFCGTECYGIGMIKEQDKQGNIEMPTRMFALFILKLRETNKEIYSQTLSSLREEMTGVEHWKHFTEDTPNRKEWESYYKKFNRVLGKMQVKIRDKPYDENKSKMMQKYYQNVSK